jgi:hypothetical protein
MLIREPTGPDLSGIIDHGLDWDDEHTCTQPLAAAAALQAASIRQAGLAALPPVVAVRSNFRTPLSPSDALLFLSKSARPLRLMLGTDQTAEHGG